MKIQFLGASRSVTGSKFLIESRDGFTLIDCGLFQGLKELRLRNWNPLPFPASQIKRVILTHAHIDHTGYLPRICKEGFHGPIYCTPSTGELLKILLPDSGRLQEEDARFAAKKGFSKHSAPQALFTELDALDALKLIQPLKFDTTHSISSGIQLRYHPTGHIIGAGSLELNIDGLRLWFSGDLGQYGDEVMRSPEAPGSADYVFVESTYGDRLHPEVNLREEFAKIILRTVERGGSLIIPAFAIGRTQSMLYHTHVLQKEGKIPKIPIFVDSPMAVSASNLYCRYGDEKNLRLDFNGPDNNTCILDTPETKFVQTVEESKQVNEISSPLIIIAASGMATGGRVVHHLAQRLPNPKNTVLLAGYQAVGTRGRMLLDGIPTLKIHGRDIPVRAEIATMTGLSAHGDQNDLLRWLSGFEKPPRQTFLIHGEDKGLNALSEKVRQNLKWSTHIPDYLEEAVLS